MGIGVLALSLPSPTSQWERLSSSHQASTRGVIEMDNLELGSTTLAQSRSLPARVVLPPTCLTQIFYNPSGGQMEAWVRPCCRKKPLISKYHPGYLDPPSSSCKRSFERYSSSSEALMTSKSQAASSMLIIGNEKVGILLFNLGGPETLEDVQPFLFNLFSNPDIFRLPRMFWFLQKPLAQFISDVRALKSKEGYASIGGGPPLRQITEALKKNPFRHHHVGVCQQEDPWCLHHGYLCHAGHRHPRRWHGRHHHHCDLRELLTCPLF